MEFIINNLGKIALITGGLVLLVLIVQNLAKIKKFVMEAKGELTKVSWSTRQELMGSTVVVISITAICTLFIFMIDFVLTKALQLVFR